MVHKVERHGAGTSVGGAGTVVGVFKADRVPFANVGTTNNGGAGTEPALSTFGLDTEGRVRPVVVVPVVVSFDRINFRAMRL